MLTTLAPLLTVAQTTDESAVSGGVVALAIGLAAALAALAWTVSRLRSSRRRLAQLSVEHESTTAAHRDLLERERKQAKKLDERRDEIRDLKRDLAAQRKKTHAAQEENKSMRGEMRSLTDELAKARNQRPAFADKPVTPRKPESKEPTREVAAARAPEPTRDAAAARAPEPTREAAAARAPDATRTPSKPPQDSDLMARVARLEAENLDKSEALDSERAALHETRAELKKLRRRVEGLRRIDLISTGKIELLEDKLHALGRQYYDAVSELAAVKGEVKPPRPRGRKTANESSQSRDEIANMADDEDDTDDSLLAAPDADDTDGPREVDNEPHPLPSSSSQEKNAEHTA